MKKGVLGVLIVIVLALLIYFLGGFASVAEPLEDDAEVVVVVSGDVVDDESTEEEVDEVDDAEATLLDLGAIVVDGNGTEPFWSFIAAGTGLTFNEPGLTGGILSNTYTITMTQNVAGTEVTMTHPAITIVATLSPCSDGMSDIVYAYSTVMTRTGDVWNGCANVN